MKTSNVILTALACGLAAGCTGVQPRNPDLRLPTAYEAPAAPAGALALDRWWTAFADPQLDRLIDTALTQSPDARTAAARLAEARAVRRSDFFSITLPSGDLKGAADRTETEQLDGTAVSVPGFSTSGTSERRTLNFDVSWEADIWGRNRAARRSINADLAAARFAYEGARASLAANVAQTYFEARGLAIQLDDARQSAKLTRELYDLAAKRADNGLAPRSEADESAATLARAEAEAARLEAELQAARRSLLILVGRPLEPTDALPTPASAPLPPPVPASVPGDLLARRPDVREAEARLRSSAAMLRVADLALLPTFNLTPGVGWTKTEQPNFASTTLAWSLGGDLLVPILDRPRLLAQLGAQNARTEQAVIAYERAVQTAYGEAENTLARLAADHRRLEILTAGEARARAAYDAARKRYALGLADSSAAVVAEQTWRGARQALTAAQVQALTRTVQAYKALGGGWTPMTQDQAFSSSRQEPKQ